MKLSTTLNKKTRAVMRSIDALSAARSFGSLSKDLHERLREVIADMGKAPESGIVRFCDLRHRQLLP